MQQQDLEMGLGTDEEPDCWSSVSMATRKWLEQLHLVPSDHIPVHQGNARRPKDLPALLHFNQEPDIERRIKLVKPLAEGGFSTVFLMMEEMPHRGRLYAMKRIQVVDEPAKKASKEEAELHEKLVSALPSNVLGDGGIMPCLWSKCIQDHFYLLMPFYPHGSLFDYVNQLMNVQKFASVHLILSTFSHLLLGVGHFHANGFAHRDIKLANIILSQKPISPDEAFTSKSSLSVTLMDFGSARTIPERIVTRRDALTLQDEAAEHCSMPYRAPELYDVRIDAIIDGRVDVWSLGCVLFAMAYHVTPFEDTVNRQGGALSMAVLGAQYKFPTKRDPQQDKLVDAAGYSESAASALHAVIRSCLTVDVQKRPQVPELLNIVRDQLSRIS